MKYVVYFLSVTDTMNSNYNGERMTYDTEES